MVENSVNRLWSKARRFCRIAGSGSFTRILSKNKSTCGRSEAMLRQFLAVRSWLCAISLAYWSNASIELFFGPGNQQFRLHSGRRIPRSACFKMFLMRLKLAASGSKSCVGRTS